MKGILKGRKNWKWETESSRVQSLNFCLSVLTIWSSLLALNTIYKLRLYIASICSPPKKVLYPTAYSIPSYESLRGMSPLCQFGPALVFAILVNGHVSLLFPLQLTPANQQNLPYLPSKYIQNLTSFYHLHPYHLSKSTPSLMWILQ